MCDVLAQQPVLLIVDNFETVSDQSIADFLVRLPASVKVLLTSREEDRLLAPVFRRFPPSPIHVGGLPDTEALTFLHMEARRLADIRPTDKRRRLDAVVQADDTILLTLVRATDGNPKALALALGHIADHVSSLETLVRDLYAAADSLSGLFDYFFHHAWERCSEDARSLWRVIPLFATSACRDALQAATGLHGRYFFDALEHLRGRSLLDVEEALEGEPHYRAHPLVRSYGSARLREQPSIENNFREKWLQWYHDLLARHAQDNWSNFLILDKEYDNASAAIEWALAHQHVQAPQLITHFWYSPYIRGYWRQCEQYTREGLAVAQMYKDTISSFTLTCRLGWLLTEQGKYEEAIPLLLKVEEAIVKMNEPSLLVDTNVLNYLGQAFLWKGNLDEAETYQQRFLAITEQLGDKRALIRARYYLALIKLRRKHDAEAKLSFQSLIGDAREIGWDRGEGYCSYRISLACIRLGELDAAMDWLLHAEEMSMQGREPLLQAHVLFGRAEIAKKRHDASGNSEDLIQARSLVSDVLDLYERLGAARDMKNATVLLQQLG